MPFTVQLVHDAFDPAIGKDNGYHTLDLLNGMISAQDEPCGWNAVVAPSLTISHLHRVNDQQILVDIPNRANYSIDSPETVSVFVPGTSLMSRRGVIAAASFVILADRGQVIYQR